MIGIYVTVRWDKAGDFIWKILIVEGDVHRVESHKLKGTVRIEGVFFNCDLTSGLQKGQLQVLTSSKRV